MEHVGQRQPEPEPELLELGEIGLVFEGDVSDPRTSRGVHQYLALLQQRISARRLVYSFRHGERVVVISELTLEFDEIVAGSVIAKTKLVGGFLLATYGAVAAYPSFKEAIPVITEDILAAVAYVAEYAPQQRDSMPPPIKVDLFLKDEEDINGQIDKRRF